MCHNIGVARPSSNPDERNTHGNWRCCSVFRETSRSTRAQPGQHRVGQDHQRHLRGAQRLRRSDHRRGPVGNRPSARSRRPLTRPDRHASRRQLAQRRTVRRQPRRSQQGTRPVRVLRCHRSRRGCESVFPPRPSPEDRSRQWLHGPDQTQDPLGRLRQQSAQPAMVVQRTDPFPDLRRSRHDRRQDRPGLPRHRRTPSRITSPAPKGRASLPDGAGLFLLLRLSEFRLDRIVIRKRSNAIAIITGFGT